MEIERKWRESLSRLVNCYQSNPNICGTKKFDLCLREKLMIARANSASLLNKCDELVSKFRYMSKFTVKFFKNR